MSLQPHNQPAHRRKRVRFSGYDSSEPSISDDSALIASSVAEHSTDASNYDSDSDSDLSESSEEPSSESSSENDSDSDSDVEMDAEDTDGVVNLRANRGRKPIMTIDKDDLGPDIRTFLKDFLPQLKAANEELEAQRAAGTLGNMKIEADEVDEAEDSAPYIEMDLGLGVLEEKNHADASTKSDSDGSDTEDGGKRKETDVIGKLMGREKAKKAVSVQEVAQ